jgi:small GTP-binding protein
MTQGMMQKKICMMGAFATGKTSLVSRYVRSVFSEKYFTTVGVKVDKHVVDVSGQELCLIVWDLHGEDEFQRVRRAYLRGSSGYVLVVDGTRRATLETAIAMQKENASIVERIPFVVALNKADLKDQWELQSDALEELNSLGCEVIETSAKTGAGVEDAFLRLSRRILGAESIGTA